MTKKRIIAFIWMLPAAIFAPFVALAASTVTIALMVIFVAIAFAVFAAGLISFIQNLFDTKEPQ